MQKLSLSLVLATVMAFAAPTGAKQIMDPASVKIPSLTAKMKLGAAAYQKFCISCHGKNLVGTDQGPTFLHKVYHPGHHGDRAFFIAPMRGVRQHHFPYGNMPPIEGIKRQHVEAIIPYIRAIQKANGLF